MRTSYRFAIAVVLVAVFLVSTPLLAAVKPAELQQIDDRGKGELEAQHYDAALTIFREGFEHATKDNEQHYVAVFSHNVGLALDLLDRSGEAVAWLDSAVQVYRKLDDRSGEALALGNLGSALWRLGRYAEAMQTLEQAVATQRVNGEPEREAYYLTRIALIETDLGQYDAALRDLESAGNSYRALHDSDGEMNTIVDIGNVYLFLGRDADAYSNYQDALDYGIRKHDLRGQAGSLSNMSVIICRRDPETALHLAKRAYDLYEQLGDAYGESATLGRMGTAQEVLGLHEASLESHRKALAISQSTNNLHSEENDYCEIGTALVGAGRFKEAVDSFARAVAIGHITGEADSWTAQGSLAYAQSKLGDEQDALANYEAALKTIDKVRGSIRQHENRTSFIQDKLYVYDEYIGYLIDLDGKYPEKGYDRKALEIFERKQSRSFLEQMGQSGAIRFGGIPEDVLLHESNLEQATDETQAKIVTARSGARPDLGHIAQLEDHIRSLKSEQNVLLGEIKQKYPAYYALRYPTPADADKLQGTLSPGEAILVYDVTKSRTIVWVVQPSSFSLFSLPGGLETVARYTAQFREGPNHILAGIENKQNVAVIARGTLDDFSQSSYELYQWLIPQRVRAVVGQAKLLYIVPTGPLYDLPFEALVTQQPTLGQRSHYLIEDQPVGYISSASLLPVLQESRLRRRKSPANPLLAFADPVFDSQATSKTSSTMGVLRSQAYSKLLGGFTGLPQTRDLVTTISQVLEASPDSSPLWLGEQASRDNVLKLNDAKKLEDYRYVVFATHAVLPDEVDGIAQPALVLSHPDRNGFLTMADVFGLTLNADFVSLSACNTGRGKQVRGEGVVGLTRAFMYAGTPSVAVTLWSVEVGSTRQLNTALFRHLRRGEPLGQALRGAKLELLNGQDELMRHPYFWAPTVLFGASK